MLSPKKKTTKLSDNGDSSTKRQRALRSLADSSTLLSKVERPRDGLFSQDAQVPRTSQRKTSLRTSKKIDPKPITEQFHKLRMRSEALSDFDVDDSVASDFQCEDNDYVPSASKTRSRPPRKTRAPSRKPDIKPPNDASMTTQKIELSLEDHLSQSLETLCLSEQPSRATERKKTPDNNVAPPVASHDAEKFLLPILESSMQGIPPSKTSEAAEDFENQDPATPPASPTKSKLMSPRKLIHRIPQGPHSRPSLDSFWSVNAVTDWNEQHSPKKVIRSPHKNHFFEFDDPSVTSIETKGSSSDTSILLSDDESDDSIPNRATKSQKPTRAAPPAEAAKATTASRRAFNKVKVDLASKFLSSLDETITSGKIAQMTAPTGGVTIIWSKKLNSTAGRANWRREAVRQKTPPGSGDSTESLTLYRHIASIELADKVIDDTERLYNVMAHEFCHLANFMVSGIKDQPHGRSFQEWARKTSKVFGKSHGVQVTTKHDYEIAYKYVWACVGKRSDEDPGCGTEFKRHSKSIDPNRQRCGRCKGRLDQVKPAPRAGDAEGTAKKPSEYQVFVKDHYKEVQAQMGEKSPMKDVMKEVGARYRAQKSAIKRTEKISISEALEDEDIQSDAEESVGNGILEVARRLNFLAIGAQ